MAGFTLVMQVLQSVDMKPLLTGSTSNLATGTKVEPSSLNTYIMGFHYNCDYEGPDAPEPTEVFPTFARLGVLH